MQKPFTLLKRLKRSRARLGILRTPHGTVHTPAYVIVATNAAVRTLRPRDIAATGTQLVIANTYHLWGSAKVHRKLGVRMPMMTDSGGFQVFSFGAAKEHGVGKVLKQPSKQGDRVSGVRITERGAHFTVDGKKRFLSAESSIAAQEKLGADIIFAFDECTSPLHPFSYQKKSMERTHRWATRSLQAHRTPRQLLFGIVQGGRFKSLRTASAKTIGGMAFDGFGIGGSFGEEGMRKSLSWVVPHLPDEKPRHLLGIGTVRDVFTAIEAGMDTFDCVIPTREARHGKIYTDDGPIDIRKNRHVADRQRLKVSRVTFAALHRLFRANDPRAGRLATLHNVSWFNTLLKNIRAALADGSYSSFKKGFLKRFSGGRGA